MNFLERLEMLMASRGINKKELAEASKIPLSTVYSWWKKGWEGITLPTLRLLCDYFGCTLDWICGDEEESESMVLFLSDEKQLVSAYRAADPAIQAAVLKLLDLQKNTTAQSAM